MRNFIQNFVPLCTCLVLSLGGIQPASAGIDWGGGSTRFFGENGLALTSKTGCAVLLAVSEGELIDFSSFIPERPEDLVSVGSVLREGANVNRIVASSCFFYSGYLLYSAIPDVESADLSALGVTDGDRLYLVVWDRDTFLDGKPTDSSYYTVQTLFEDGVNDAPARVSLSSDTVYALVAYPDSEQTADQTLLAAQKAGHNTVRDYLEWLAAQAGALPADGDPHTWDTNGNGRSDFEEYVFRSSPRLSGAAPTVSSDASGLESDELVGDAADADSEPAFVVELRASDTSLAYTAHASGDLSSWQAAEIYFDQGAWRSSVADFNITGSEYLGEGVWSVAMRYEGGQSDGRRFYKMSADEIQ